MTDIRDYIEYNPITGEFIWKKRHGTRTAVGKSAGSINSEGYRIIKFCGISYKASHVAVFCMTGKWPQRFMDHRNLIRSDNIWTNLREATRSQNGANRASWGKLGIKGVKLITGSSHLFQASLRKDGKDIYLGCYKTIEDADAAYKRAAKAYHGEFAFKREDE